MGSGFSRLKHGKHGTESHQHIVCSCGNQRNAQDHQTTAFNVRNSLDVVETNQQFQNNITNDKTLNASFNSQRPKRFYYYPQKKSSDPASETLFVSTSQFPYNKPKAVAVRQPRELKHDNQQVGLFPASRGQTYECYPEMSLDQPVHVRPKDAGTSFRSYKFINERRWSIPNIISTTEPRVSNFVPNSVLQHRTISELRNSNHDDFECARGQSFITMKDGSRRPPTPTPNAWYPAIRTDDYLVASSLLAVERERDRHKQMKNNSYNNRNF